jgi:hypothetical protein
MKQPLCQETGALKTNDEINDLVFVTFVFDEKHKQPKQLTHHGHQTQGCHGNPFPISHLTPYGAVVGMHGVEHKRTNAMTVPPTRGNYVLTASFPPRLRGTMALVHPSNHRQRRRPVVVSFLVLVALLALLALLALFAVR